MAHFARLNSSNEVIFVTPCDNSLLLEDVKEVRDNVRAITHLRNTISKLFPEEGDQWIQTSYNNNFRKIFASIGLLYSDKGDVFYPPQPYASWILDSNYDWQAPIAVPSELSELTAPEVYDWDEDVYQADNTKGWVKIE